MQRNDALLNSLLITVGLMIYALAFPVESDDVSLLISALGGLLVGAGVTGLRLRP